MVVVLGMMMMVMMRMSWCESSWCGGEEGVGSVITVLEMMMGMMRMMIMRWRVSHRDGGR